MPKLTLDHILQTRRRCQNQEYADIGKQALAEKCFQVWCVKKGEESAGFRAFDTCAWAKGAAAVSFLQSLRNTRKATAKESTRHGKTRNPPNPYTQAQEAGFTATGANLARGCWSGPEVRSMLRNSARQAEKLKASVSATVFIDGEYRCTRNGGQW